MREIKAQFLCRNKGSLLLNSIAKDLTKSIVENMSTSMIISDWPAPKLRPISIFVLGLKRIHTSSYSHRTSSHTERVPYLMYPVWRT